MDWAYCWLFLGAAAFILALLNLLRLAQGKERGWQVLLFASLSCGVLTMLCMYQMVNGWVKKEDWSALMDCVPPVSALMTIAVVLGILLNLLALWLYLRLEKKEGGA